MSRPRTAKVSVESRVIVVTGWQVARVLTDAGLKPIYAGTVKGWMLDRHRLGDVLAALENKGIVVDVGEAA